MAEIPIYFPAECHGERTSEQERGWKEESERIVRDWIEADGMPSVAAMAHFASRLQRVITAHGILNELVREEPAFAETNIGEAMHHLSIAAEGMAKTMELMEDVDRERHPDRK